jgi:hypothetical protein
MIRRKAYSYTRRDGRRVHVPPCLIKNRGSHGRGKVQIGPLKKGLLGHYGYYHVKNMTVSQRHAALKKAIRKLGRLHVERSLTAAATYTKRTSPKSSSRLRANERYIRRV